MDLIRACAALALLAGCADEKATDSYEAGYARAYCRKVFECFPNHERKNDLDDCTELKTAWLDDLLTRLGDQCAGAALTMLACRSQAGCYDAAKECESPVNWARAECPGETILYP